MNTDSVNILGSRVDLFEDYESVYLRIKNYVESNTTPGFITVNNVHTIVEAAKDRNYKKILEESFLSLPDGRPLSIYQKIKKTNASRIMGPTLFEKTLQWSRAAGFSHFFFGSDQNTLDQIVSEINQKYTGVKIAGTLAPPFTEFLKSENNIFLKKINESQADIIWVGLGAPKQEKWIYENYTKLNKGLMIGVGAGFDYFVGKLKHAPGWMKNFSLEWFYRMLQDPRRLWKRYLIANSKFIYYLALEFFRLKRF